MKRVIYFGTPGGGQAGHYFKAVKGTITREEEKSLAWIDSPEFKSKVEKPGKRYHFFHCLGYGGMCVFLSPDDQRGGCITAILVKGATREDEVLEALNASPFIRQQFDRLCKEYKFTIPM